MQGIYAATLIQLNTVAEASENLESIFRLLKNIASVDEVADWAELRVVLGFLGKLGLVNCLDLTQYVTGTRVNLMQTRREQANEL